jgi:PPK2 family polyphosphate:nucleotide phosphotransferase
VANSDKKSGKKNSASKSQALASTFRAPLGEQLDVTAISTKATPAGPQSREDAEAALAELGPRLAAQQEMLVAQGSAGDPRRVLLVLQGMDTAGKGGIVTHVVAAGNPMGVDYHSFGKPTPEERSHHFLWRINKALPPAGHIGVFDRSHYEDVLVVRVHRLVPADELEGRYDEINAFESELIEAGTSIVKVAMFVSLDEQKARLTERLQRPDKFWKYNPGDLDERALWPSYQEAYQVMLERTSTDGAPWYVLPCDKKWYARLAVNELLVETLTGMNLSWPPADFDLEAERARVAAL